MAKRQSKKAQDVKVRNHAMDEIRQGAIQGLREVKSGLETAREDITQGFSRAAHAILESLSTAKDRLFSESRSTIQ